jgi:hypothetical protein
VAATYFGDSLRKSSGGHQAKRRKEEKAGGLIAVRPSDGKVRIKLVTSIFAMSCSNVLLYRGEYSSHLCGGDFVNLVDGMCGRRRYLDVAIVFNASTRALLRM